MKALEHADEWTRIAGKTQVLVRSRIEIAAVLQSLVDRDLPLVSHHQIRDRLFIAKLLRVCPEQNLLIIGYSDNKSANADVFAARSVVFYASHDKGCVRFMAGNPIERHDPVQAIQFDFPGELYIEQRRAGKRIHLIPETRLSCLADSGGPTPFEASIVDVGLAGIGVMVHDPAIRLASGTVLAGCRVDLPDGGVAVLDIQVMHTSNLVLLDGRPVRRAGCRFIGDPAQIDRLLKVFVLDLEDRDGHQAPP